MNEPVKLFISYSHQDDELRKELSAHLSGLQHKGLIAPWHDRNIDAGEEWAEKIDDNLERAGIILLLVSSDFINSKYCYSIEMNQALKLHRDGTVVVIPVVIRDCVWVKSPLGELQGIPRDNKAVATWGDKYARDTAWTRVSEEICKAAQQIIDKQNSEIILKQKTKAREDFRAKVESFYQDGVLSPAEKSLLKIEKNLGLEESEADQILHDFEVFHEQHQINLAEYQKILIQELAGQYELKNDQKIVLKQLQDALGVNDDESDLILQLMVEKNRNLVRFGEELQKTVNMGYPLDNHVKSGIRDFQVSLNLTDDDVVSINADVLALAELEHQKEISAKTDLTNHAKISDDVQKSPEIVHSKAVFKSSFFEFDFIAVDVNDVSKYSRGKKVVELFTEILNSEIILEMIKIPKGTFQMGASGWFVSSDQKPQHDVTIPEFWMGKYPVTQAQWRAVALLHHERILLNPEPCVNRKGDNYPVEGISWSEVVEFCKRLSRKTGYSYRLPSEAEWEYSCRAGTNTNFYCGNSLTSELANFNSFVGKPSAVGKYMPNAFGLYDMHGNVWEWCADCWHSNYQDAPINGSSWIEPASIRNVLRGGSWYRSEKECTVNYRFCEHSGNRSGDVGFRLACEV
jgi:formylglycine-generating enzyme required for sulfatase activity